MLAHPGALDVRAACKLLSAGILNRGFANNRFSEWGQWPMIIWCPLEKSKVLLFTQNELPIYLKRIANRFS